MAVLDTLYGGFKTVWQKMFGEKKVENSESLLNNAVKNTNNESLQLILDLELPSIAGSEYKLVDGIAAIISKGKSLFNTPFNRTDSGAERIISFYALGSGGPKNIAELHVMLEEVTKNPDSRKLILDELKEAMTGYGK
jgi:hypothetical protein